MTSKIQALTAAALAALALNLTQTAHAQDVYAQTEQMPQPGQPRAPQQAPASPRSALSRADQDFLNDATQAGMLEVQSSQLALQKSSNPAVKQFAQKMIDDHGKMGEELKALASRKGFALPTGLSVVQQTKFKTLDIRDESFDKGYVDKIAVSAHEDAVKLFKKASTESRDADIKAFAQKNLPTLQSHLQMGQQLKKSMQTAK